jgi:glycosyltransferase involved in cell wall biosynthesis
VGVSNDVCLHLREQLPGLATSKVRLIAIPNSIDISRYHDLHPQPHAFLREQLNLSRETQLLGFLGRYVEEKGFTILLQALQQLKHNTLPHPVHLVAVGSGDKRKQYEREVVERGLESLVTMLDYTPDVLPLLRQFDLLVVPSLQEASSLVSMEAMAVGVPVLGSDCIGLREVLQGTPSRTFRSADPGALARELLLALGNLWTDEAVDFAPQARQRFDSSCSAQQFLDLYDELFKASISTGMVIA